MLSFHVKFVQTDRRTDKRTDRQTTVKQYAPPPPDLSIRGHKNENVDMIKSNLKVLSL